MNKLRVKELVGILEERISKWRDKSVSKLVLQDNLSFISTMVDANLPKQYILERVWYFEGRIAQSVICDKELFDEPILWYSDLFDKIKKEIENEQ